MTKKWPVLDNYSVLTGNLLMNILLSGEAAHLPIMLPAGEAVKASIWMEEEVY